MWSVILFKGGTKKRVSEHINEMLLVRSYMKSEPQCYYIEPCYTYRYIRVNYTRDTCTCSRLCGSLSAYFGQCGPRNSLHPERRRHRKSAENMRLPPPEQSKREISAIGLYLIHICMSYLLGTYTHRHLIVFCLHLVFLCRVHR